MPKITFIRKFSHADDVYPVTYEPGDHEVSDRCAEVALAEGFARPFGEGRQPGLTGLEPGGEDKSSSPPPAPASPKPTSKRSPRGKAARKK